MVFLYNNNVLPPREVDAFVDRVRLFLPDVVAAEDLSAEI